LTVKVHAFPIFMNIPYIGVLKYNMKLVRSPTNHR
jgi:hypothetical protein